MERYSGDLPLACKTVVVIVVVPSFSVNDNQESRHNVFLSGQAAGYRWTKNNEPASTARADLAGVTYLLLVGVQIVGVDD